MDSFFLGSRYIRLCSYCWWSTSSYYYWDFLSSTPRHEVWEAGDCLRSVIANILHKPSVLGKFHCNTKHVLKNQVKFFAWMLFRSIPRNRTAEKLHLSSLAHPTLLQRANASVLQWCYSQDRASYIEVAKPFHVFPTYGLENFNTIAQEIASYLYCRTSCLLWPRNTEFFSSYF